MLRSIIMLATLVGTGLAAGRKLADRAIEKRLSAEIELAKGVATRELQLEVSKVLKNWLGAFAVRTGAKLAILLLFFWLYFENHLSETGLQIVMAVSIAVFVVTDAVRVGPSVLLAARQVYTHQWRLKTAIAEFVAGIAFQRAYERAIEQTTDSNASLFLKLSSFTEHDVSTQVAEAVEDLTRKTSFDHIWPRAAIGLAIAVLILTIYSGVLIATFNSI